ncbi:DUF1819 family protein [Polaribacter tangerinus]|uniref:DUF1819 family protein n=1 Tax=Polaribacter tangerinus TaxID=1920034 RepID=UPI000B4BC795|nr:DUF1819 family protein [Polaribacter tangerinus]
MIESNLKYEFSFTASSLRVNDMVLFATKYLNEGVMEFNSDKGTTNKRMVSEFKKRIDNLTVNQQELLLNSNFSNQKQLAFLSACKTYSLLRDFVIEVVREKFLIMDYNLTETDYISFIRRKEINHDELANLTDQTQAKVKQVIFKILEQAGIIDNVRNKEIQLQILGASTKKSIIEDNPEWLKVFLLSDMDIQNELN